MKHRVLPACAIASAALLFSANVWADNIATIEGYASGTAVTLDSDPVVTAILSQPSTVNGRTYSTWSVAVQDSSGSLFLFGALPGGSAYTPTVGDAISAAGTYSPYHQIPEIGTLTDISASSSGNPVPTPGVSSIPTLNQATLPQNVAGYLWELDDVTISGISGTFDIANLTGTITDASNNSMTFYYWPTSYSAVNANLFGTPVPTGPVNMVGFVSVFTSGGISTPEFTPLTITAIPEPTTLSLVGLGLLGFLTARKRPA